MKYRNGPSIFKSRLGLFIIIVAVVVLLLIVFGSRASSSNPSKNNTINNSVNKTQESTQAVNVKPETNKTELEKIIEKTLSEKGLCEDYNFNEGDSLKIKNNVITLDRVSSTTAKLAVDNKTVFLKSGDNKVVDDLRIELHEGNLHYFGYNDKDNLVVLRIGCKHADEDPNEKYIRERGEKLCQEVYTQCRESFGIA